MNRKTRKLVAGALLLGALTLTSACDLIKHQGSEGGRSYSSTRDVPEPEGRPGSALAALQKLQVKPLGSLDGYQRTVQFGRAWTDDNGDPLGNNGCDTRNDVLKRDLTSVAYKYGDCEVATGTLADPYTGKVIHFKRGVRTSSLVQIDHIIPLGLAYKSGAEHWTDEKRVNLATDPLNLLAVDGPSNSAKGDSDAGEWMPDNTRFQCRYVSLQVAVSAKYGIPVSPDAKRVMVKVLSACPSQVLPGEPGGQR